MAQPDLEMKAIGFPTFGGLRLDQALDEVGANNSIYQHDVDWDGSLGKIRTRDGFQKLNASAASGEYKGLYPHSALRLLAVKRIKSTEAKIVALDKEGTEKATNAWPEQEVPSTFAHFGNTGGTSTIMRAFTPAAPTLYFDGSAFHELKATIENVTETGEKETPKTEKAMPLARHMVAWPDAGNVVVYANTSGTNGGPNGAPSSSSYVWISKPGLAERFEETAFLALGVGDGEEITGVTVYGAQLYVFKESKFFVVSPPSVNEHGQPVFSFREVTLGEGSRIKQVLTTQLKETSDNICWASQDGIFFCTTDGIYQTRGSEPVKISEQLKPLEETVPFEGPMAEFLNGSTESFRWPATGICVLGRRIFVKRYEFIFVYDLNLQAWNCWKMPSVSMAIWTGLTGGGSETTGSNPSTAVDNAFSGTAKWENPDGVLSHDGEWATAATTKKDAVTHFLQIGGFDFSAIPAGSTLVGIVLYVERHANQGGVHQPPWTSAVNDVVVSLGRTKDGSVGENKAKPAAWLADHHDEAEELAVFGGAEELWGTPWSLAQLAELEVFLSASLTVGNAPGVFARVAWVGIQVFYLTSETASGVRPRLFCAQSKYVYWTGPNAEEQATFPGWAWQSGLYDLGSEDEKELVKSKLWANGDIKVATSEDFKAMKERHEFQMGEVTTQKQQNISQKATMFSHRFEGSGKASIQRFVRYLRTTATSGSQSDPS